jgi:glycerophosphoryl diester phosphodiesterase
MRMRTILAATLVAACATPLLLDARPPEPQRPAEPRTPWLIAHRGASAYAPENTIPAFVLAADQGATYVEFDLRLSKDREIVCLHDDSLERTTDVEQVFPDRARTGARGAKRWLLEDFTLAEL